MRRITPIMLVLLVFGAVFGVLPGTASAQDNGVARTPPMGWNSWNKFGCAITEDAVHGVADALVSSGLAAAGYAYVTVDDCWMAKSRDAAGNLVGDPVRFPSGMRALADYLHTRGLKFGLYESPTQGTCQKRPGSYGHEQADADTFAAWGVDYLKYDWCQTAPSESPQMWADFPGKTEQQIAQTLFTRMSGDLTATGRPIVYSLSACCSALDFPNWAGAVANLWRTSTDINDSWSSMISNYGAALPFQAAAGPGRWNDPDMLEVGNGGMTSTEYHTHLSLWAMLAAPLIAGNDVRSMSADTSAILGNRSALAVDQDPLGVPATVIGSNGGGQALSRPLANGDRAVLLLNTGSSARTMTTSTVAAGLPEGNATITDLWSGATGVGSTITATVPAHGAALYRVSGGPAGATELVGQDAGRCLDISGGGTADGTPAIIWDCHGGPNQQFTATDAGEVRVSGKCLGLTPNAVDGTRLQLWTCDGGNEQKFSRRPDGTIVGVDSGKCLDVSGGATANNAPVIAYTCHGTGNQLWLRR